MSAAPFKASQRYALHLRVLTVPGPDTDLSVYVVFDNERYLFGVGEATQRAFVQKGLSTKGLSGIFLPDGGSKGRAGLPGMIMTACDSGIRKLNVVGPADTTHYIASVRMSVMRNEIALNIDSHPSISSRDDVHDVFQGQSLRVQSVALRPSVTDRPVLPQRSMRRQNSGQRISEKYFEQMFQRPVLGNRAGLFPIQPVPASEETKTHMVYICHTPSVPGTFDNAKAAEIGVPNGKIRAQLVRGETIEFPDPKHPGQTKVVRSEEVVSPTSDGPTFVFVNASVETLPDLLASTVFDTYRGDRSDSEPRRVSAIIHRVPTTVWQNKQYQEWMESFGPKTQHLIASTDGYKHDAVFNSSAWNLLQLSSLDEDLFPPIFTATPSSTQLIDLPSNTTLLAERTRLKLQPAGALEMIDHLEKDVPYPTSPAAAEEARARFLQATPDFAERAAIATQKVREDPRFDQGSMVPGDDITVTTLGTGSAIPSKYRNVSSTHLSIPGLGGVLLDCGEGTLGQMRRRFGPDGIVEMYRNLKMIFISHMHADHHLGLQSILEDRFRHGIHSKLYIVAPLAISVSLAEIGTWSNGVAQEALDNVVPIDIGHLRYWSASEDLSTIPQEQAAEIEEARQIEHIADSAAFLEGSARWPRWDLANKLYRRKHSEEWLAALVSDLGLSELQAPNVHHRGSAWGLAMSHSSGWKIVYSGDTKPSENLVKAGQGATLLIHEATLEDDKPETALEKGHSTFSQAIEVGVRMDAKRILLNHFSQRYPKIPKSRAENDANRDISISYDLMTMKVGDMWKMKYYMDAAEMLFGDEDDADVEGAVKADVNVSVADVSQGGKKKGANGKQPKQPKQGKGRGEKGEKRVGDPAEEVRHPKRTKSDEAAINM